MADLDLPEVIRALSGHEARRERFVAETLAELCPAPEVIIYRQEAIGALLDDAELRAELARVVPGLDALVRHSLLRPEEWAVFQITHRVVELELIVEVATQLQTALSRAQPNAAALRALQEQIAELTGAPEFVALATELPELRACLEGVRSITIGINLSDNLTPESAAILSMNTERIEGRSVLLERLMGRESGRRGITPLRAGDMQADSPLTRDLRKLLERVATPVGEALGRYAAIQARLLTPLEPELAFLLNGVALIERLRAAGLPMCRPELAAPDERACRVEDAYNVSLALRMLDRSKRQHDAEGGIITNAVCFGADGCRVWILTGPNRGGKTTYTRAVGLIQALGQAGLYVPASSARLSPVDAIYTHFPAPESADLGHGRLDDEAARLAAIFQHATPHSLILLNEVLAGTSTLEALALAFDTVRGLHLLGARAIYVTHLHELATRCDEINGRTAGDGTVGSLVADVDDESLGEGGHRRTYRVRVGPPRGESYASEIAEQHGISYPQLERLLRARGVVSHAPIALD